MLVRLMPNKAKPHRFNQAKPQPPKPHRFNQAKPQLPKPHRFNQAKPQLPKPHRFNQAKPQPAMRTSWDKQLAMHLVSGMEVLEEYQMTSQALILTLQTIFGHNQQPYARFTKNFMIFPHVQGQLSIAIFPMDIMQVMNQATYMDI